MADRMKDRIVLVTGYAALFLALDEARYITGVQLPVDGGITLRCA